MTELVLGRARTRRRRRRRPEPWEVFVVFMAFEMITVIAVAAFYLVHRDLPAGDIGMVAAELSTVVVCGWMLACDGWWGATRMILRRWWIGE